MINRIAPVGPAGAYKTYMVGTPKVYQRQVTCEEFGCLNFRNGFKVPVPAGPSHQAYLIKTSGKPYTVEEGEDGTKFAVFPPGTKCFAEITHKVASGPELYVVRGGDWRGNPTGYKRVHKRPDDWVEDFQEHTDKITTEARRG